LVEIGVPNCWDCVTSLNKFGLVGVPNLLGLRNTPEQVRDSGNANKEVSLILSIWQIIVVVVVGIVGGFVNTLAGGGSLLTLPALIFVGLPSGVANGTNRVAILIQNVTAVAGFKQQGLADFKFSLELSAPAVVGAILGARLAIDISDALFQKVLAAVMLLVVGLILWNPTRRWQGDQAVLSPQRRLLAAVAFFFVGLYGGFIQAGVGFIIIAALVLITGLDLVRTNSHKVFVVGVYTLAALATFALSGKVNWGIGLVLAVGNGIGGWIGSQWAVVGGEKWIKIVLAVTVVAMAAKLLGLIPAWP